MITQQITAIALRLLAIWLLIHLILNLPSLIVLFSSYSGFNQYGLLVGLFLLIGLVAAFLINKAATSVLLKTKSEAEGSLNDDAQKLLFQLVGLYFVVDALVSLPRTLVLSSQGHAIDLTHWLWFGGLIFQLIVGLWLAGNSAFWLKLFNQLRGRT